MIVPITRVRPVFQSLIERDRTGASWLPGLLGLATEQSNYATGLARNPGQLLADNIAPVPFRDRTLKRYGLAEIQLEPCFELPAAAARTVPALVD